MSDFIVPQGTKITTLGDLVVTGSVQASQTSPGGPVTLVGGNGGINITTSLTTTLPFTITTGIGSDNIKTGTGADKVNGGPGSDIISTGAGADIVTDSPGKDTVTLGGGADTFLLPVGLTKKFTKNTISLVTDFSHTDDTITLSKSLLKGSKFKSGVLKNSSFASVKKISQIGENVKSLIVYEQKTGIVYFDPVKGKNLPLVDLPANQKTIKANDFTIF
jgi:Ca2+-binding RTX toxin-like protein